MVMNLDQVEAVTLKGTKEGVQISLGEGEWSDLLANLKEQLERPGAAAFFRGARVSLNLGERQLTEEELNELNTLLESHDLLVGPALAPLTVPEQPPAQDFEEIFPAPADGSAGTVGALMIRRTLRSGQIVQHPGHVVVFGDVNDGAEIVAGGDVLVWGRVRGLVHAGAAGDDHAVIGALLLSPPQVRIGNFIARAPEESKKKKARGPEMATVRDGRILIELWKV